MNSTTDRIQAESRKDPAELEHEIDQQRLRVEQLVEALENRLSPSDLVDRMVGVGKDGGREFAANLGNTVRANPMPTLLTAAGMLWLYAQKDRRVDRDLQSRTAEGDDHSLHDSVSDKWDATKDRAGSAKDFTSRKMHDAGDSFQQMLDENPLALGAMGVAVGALLGGMLPSTDAEDRWMGDMRERVGQGVRQEARAVTESGDSSSEAPSRDRSSGYQTSGYSNAH